MTPQDLTRRFYERSPYSPPAAARSKAWRLPPLEWILSMYREGAARPRQVLTAGCGTGSEAFLLQQALREAKIVGADFSARSICEARKAQARSPFLKRIRFVEADLADPGFSEKVGGEFDLVVCHGVLSYIPPPGLALRLLAGAFARCR